MRTRHLLPTFVILLAVLPLAACNSVQTKEGAEAATAVSRVWPAPPATARIRLVRTITKPQDLGITGSFFRRLVDRITGAPELQLVRPSGVAERDDVVYVADPGAQSLWILDPAGNRFTRVQQAGDNRLVSPVAVAVRADGAVYVADSWAGKVLLFDRKGRYLGVTIQSGLQRPAGLAWDDRAGRLYVADSAAQQVVVFDAQGKKLFAWGRRGTSPGEFNYPTHLGLDADGQVLVTDALNFRIQAFDRDGKYLWQFGRHGDGSGDLALPKGVAVDSGQHVYVVDALFGTVQLFRQDGTYLMSFGSQGSAPGQFWLPGGLYIDAKDRIFVADAYNRRIQEFAFIHSRVTPGADHSQ